jgi:uncharacterized iron-regulated protein
MRRKMSTLRIFLAAALMVLSSGPAALAHPHPELLETNLMPYPFWTAPQPNDIYHIPTGLKLSFKGMMDMMDGSRIIYVGETHNNVHAHRVQLEILRELKKRYPQRIAVGMEMFREPQQESLDRWTRGELTELQFLQTSRWFENWGSSFGYYRDIMNFARDKDIDVVALNPPMDLQYKVGMGKPLTPEQQAQIPETDSSDPYQRAVIQAVYGAHERGEQMQKAFLRVQLLWEENMAEQIVNYLGSPRGEGKIMVVFTGENHVQYGFGVPKKVVRRLPVPYHIVLPAILSRPDESPDDQATYMSVDMPDIPLLAGDFIWAVPYETLSEEKVLMGIRLNFEDGSGVVTKVGEDSAAMKAGVLPGDILVKLDGEEIRAMEDVSLIMRSKTVGDSINIRILRDGEEMAFRAHFTESANHPG